MRFVFTLLVLWGFSSAPALAADDGGFGAARFSGKTPSALEESQTDLGLDPAQIEPAAGDEASAKTAAPAATAFLEKEPIDCLTDKDCQAGWVCDVQSVPCETDPQASECVRKACMPDTSPEQKGEQTQ
jgi:hypothetical protein